MADLAKSIPRVGTAHGRRGLGIVSFGVLAYLYLLPLLNASTGGITAAEWLVAGLLLVIMYLWVLRRLAIKRSLFVRHPLTKPLLLFLAILGMSSLHSLLIGVNLLEIARWLFRFSPLLLFFVIATEFDSERKLRYLVTAYLIAGLIVALQALLFFLDNSAVGLERFNEFRAAVLQFASPLFVPAFVLALALLVHVRNPRLRIALLILVGVLGTRIVVHGGRLGVAETLFAIAMLMWLAFRGQASGPARRLVLLGTAVSVLVAMLIIGDVGGLGEFWVGRFGSETLQRAQGSRLEEFRSALESISGWSFAIGDGMAAEFVRSGPTIERLRAEGEVSFVHSYPIFALKHWGLIGIIAFYWLAYRSLHVGFRLLRYPLSPFHRGLVAGVLSLLTALYLGSIISGALTTRDLNVTLAVSYGILTIIRQLTLQPTMRNESDQKEQHNFGASR